MAIEIGKTYIVNLFNKGGVAVKHPLLTTGQKVEVVKEIKMSTFENEKAYEVRLVKGGPEELLSFYSGHAHYQYLLEGHLKEESTQLEFDF